MKCPKCGGECWRDDVDIGVGTLHGPWNCRDCSWTSRNEEPEMGDLDIGGICGT